MVNCDANELVRSKAQAIYSLEINRVLNGATEWMNEVKDN